MASHASNFLSIFPRPNSQPLSPIRRNVFVPTPVSKLARQSLPRNNNINFRANTLTVHCNFKEDELSVRSETELSVNHLYRANTPSVVMITSFVRVMFEDCTTCAPELVAFDNVNDIGILHVETPKKLIPIQRGTSANLMVGQKAYCIAYAFAFSPPSITDGVISGLQRQEHFVEVQTFPKNLILTSTTIHPGSNGGALLDSSGCFIGMIVGLHSPSGCSCRLGFAIPVDTVVNIVDELLSRLKN